MGYRRSAERLYRWKDWPLRPKDRILSTFRGTSVQVEGLAFKAERSHFIDPPSPADQLLVGVESVGDR